MNLVVLSFLFPLLVLVQFIVALTCYSLRDYSRSRLDEVCQERATPQRFGEILRLEESALLSFDSFLLVLSVLSSITAVQLVRDLIPESWDLLIVVELILLVLSMLVTQLVSLILLPWTLARSQGEKWLCSSFSLISLGPRLLSPIVAAARTIDQVVHRLSGLPEPDRASADSLAEEILSVVDEGQREGLLLSEARTMIHRVIELKNEDAAAIMTPRTEMISVAGNTGLDEARAIMLDSGHSRVPVLGESTDDVLGILHAKDLLKHLSGPEQNIHRVDEICRDPFYVPETTSIDTLLEMMRREHVHLAIVLDEYSGVAGLVTMEDILEEIVGEIEDEYDEIEDDGIVEVAPQTWIVSGRVHIDDLNERFEMHLPEDGDYDTISGFVYTQLSRVPAQGESFEWGQLRFTVNKADRRRLHEIRIEMDEALAPFTVDE